MYCCNIMFHMDNDHDMDMLMIDVGNILCNEGDEVEIFGQLNSANDFSKKNKTISYELMTSIGPRVKRVFLS